MRNPVPLLRDLGGCTALAFRLAREGRPALATAVLRIWGAVVIDRALRRTGPFEARVDGIRFTYGDAGTFLFVLREVFVGRCYDLPLEHATTIVDGGANIGVATAYLARRHPEATILAFEPDPETFDLLARNVNDNGLTDRVTLHRAALGRRDGTARWQTDGAGGVHAHLLEDADDSSAADVPIRCLSSFLTSRVDLLKLDVEGAELDVLEELSGAGALERVQAMVVEVHHAPESPTRLTQILGILDAGNFEYSVRAGWLELAGRQDILITARRRAAGAHNPTLRQ